MPIREVACPNCGAPVDFPDDQTRFIKCKFCGTSIARTDLPPEPKPQVIITPPVSSAPARLNVGRLVVVLVGFWLCSMLAIVPMFFIPDFREVWNQIAGQGQSSSTTSSSRIPQVFGPQVEIYNFGKIQVFPRSESENLAILSASTQKGGSFLTYLDSKADTPARWRFDLGENPAAVDTHFALDEKRLFFVNGPRLVTFDRLNGQTLWQVSLSDRLESDCQKCLAAFEKTLVVLSMDGRLTGFNLESGARAWDFTLEGTPDEFEVSGGLVLVKDEKSEPSYHLFDPNTGKEIRTITPSCPNNTFKDSPQYPDAYDPVMADETAFYVFTGWYEPACLQKWDSASGEMVYQSLFPTEYLKDPTFYPHIFNEGYIFSADQKSVVIFNTTDGFYQAFAVPSDYRFEAVGIESGVFVVMATKTRGTQTQELWGLDAAGKRLWTYKPAENASLHGFTDILSSRGWFYMFAPGKVLVFEGTSDPDTLTLEVLDIQNGASTGARPIALGTINSIIFFVRSLGYYDGAAWLMVDNRILSIDPATAAITFRWP